MCKSCKVPKRQVFFYSSLLNGMSDKDLKTILNKCSVVKPIHVLKISKEQAYGHLHFENEANASSFYHLYHNNSHVLCRKFENVVIKPSRENGVDVTYDITLFQRRVDEDTSGWCTCSIISSTDNIGNNENVPATSSPDNIGNNENVPATSSDNTTPLKRLIQELKEEIKKDEGRLERKRKKLKLLQDADEV